MCRFSCPTAETLRLDTVTPRAKMSLLHLAERGFKDEVVAGTGAQRAWFLEQCTGCGRCTEHCKWEVDVASELRRARASHFERLKDSFPQPRSPFDHSESMSPEPSEVLEPFRVDVGELASELSELKGTVLWSEPGRKEWWIHFLESRGAHPFGVDMGVRKPITIVDYKLPHELWAWGRLSRSNAMLIARALRRCNTLWIESPAAAWFLAQGLGEELRALTPRVRLLWQAFYVEAMGLDLGPHDVFHESWHLTRLFPRASRGRQGYSIPMYEKGFLPFHHGWNVLDCGGEGHYRFVQPKYAEEMGHKWFRDVASDGRKIRKIVCQNYSCLEHLRPLLPADVAVTYWLDDIARRQSHARVQN